MPTLTTNQKLTLTARPVDATSSMRLGGEMHWTQDDGGKVVRLVAIAPAPPAGSAPGIDVIPLAPGVATITATDADSGQSSSVQITVVSGVVVRVDLDASSPVAYIKSDADRKEEARIAKEKADAEEAARKQRIADAPKPLVTITKDATPAAAPAPVVKPLSTVPATPATPTKPSTSEGTDF